MTLKLSRDEARDLFAAYALGALLPEEADAVRETVAAWSEGRAEIQELMETATVLSLVPDESAWPSIALEGRIMTAARQRRSREQLWAHARQSMAKWRRRLPHTLAAVFAAVALAVGLLWLTEADPVPDGRWLPLQTQVSAAPGGWVFVTDLEGVPVSLLFRDTQPSPEGTSYQLFRILTDGDTLPDRVFRIAADGSAMMRIDPRPDADLRGFAVVLIEGDEPLPGTPTAESVVFTFPAR
jgi:hypothetical protein